MIQDIFIKTNQIKSALCMIWLTEILRICLEEQINYCKLLHDLGLNTSRNKIDIIMDLLQWFINVFIKILRVALLQVQINLLLNVKLWQTNN